MSYDRMSSWKSNTSHRCLPPFYPKESAPIYIFLLCYNERALLPHTIAHYKRNIPSCSIILYDNESTDGSVELGISLGCSIQSWSSNNTIDDYKYIDIKNNCWKAITQGWIIVADMDEWLCITEKQLQEEYKKGTSILQTRGINIVGTSQTTDLTDMDPSLFQQYIEHPPESKHLCFLREKIKEMSYSLGAHSCMPKGIIQYSTIIYDNKHMHYMGLPFLLDKMKKRYTRSKKMRAMGIATHYTDDVQKITHEYQNAILISSTMLSSVE